jgi:16S rRNA C1402 (ribose-2'-O) methylase RsmI
LTNVADIIACEDTRKTGKLLEIILERKMKGKFKSAFGADFDTFWDSD